MYTFGPGLAYDPITLRGIAGAVGVVTDVTTGNPLTTYELDGTTQAPVVTNRYGYFGQFQAVPAIVDIAFTDHVQRIYSVEGLLANAGGGWWKDVPLTVPDGASSGRRTASPFVTSNELKLFSEITGPVFMPGPQTLNMIVQRVGTAGAGGTVGKVYTQDHVPNTRPERSTATFLVDIPVSSTGRQEVTLSPALVIPEEGMWFWFESTDANATVRASRPLIANANWSNLGSLDAGSMPIAGADASNPDLGKVYCPFFIFRRSA